jgi:hypothetical protein
MDCQTRKQKTKHCIYAFHCTMECVGCPVCHAPTKHITPGCPNCDGCIGNASEFPRKPFKMIPKRVK